MSQRSSRAVSSAVRRRLLNIARQRGEDFNLVIIRYGLERLLYRLSQSSHGPAFVLKGAMLFQLWADSLHRATKDLDLHGSGHSSVEGLERVFRDVCLKGVQDDGLNFLAETVAGEEIRGEHEYDGVRIQLEARLHDIPIRLRVDVGFGDTITPPAREIDYPTLLDFPAPRVRAYPKESVVSEKFQAMVMLGIANSRMKDFYDLWVLARDVSFDGAMLAEAIRATFHRRRTPLPEDLPLALTPEFYDDHSKQTQWRAFLSRGRLVRELVDFADVISLLESFLLPPARAALAGATFGQVWAPGGPWRQ